MVFSQKSISGASASPARSATAQHLRAGVLDITRNRRFLVSKDSGFSLLELLIVVGIILIIATLAVPSLLQSRRATNETAAVTTLKQINTAQVTYSTAAKNMYGSMDELVTSGFLDSSLRTTK